MRKHRPPPLPSVGSDPTNTTQFPRMVKWGARQNSVMPSDALQPPNSNLPSSSDGPRSLPTRRFRSSQEYPRDTSYSSFAKRSDLAVILDDARITPQLSLPGRASDSSRPLPPPNRSKRNHSLHQEEVRRLRSHRVEHLPDSATLTRSDSLLNRARRVFSLPSSLKRRATRPAFVESNLSSAHSAYTVDGEPSAGVVYRRRGRSIEPVPLPAGTSFSNRTARRATRPHAHELRQRSDMLDEVSQAHIREADARIRVLENQVEAERHSSARLRKRIHELEEETAMSRQALPAVENILKSALTQFEGKEAALKHTIAKMDQEHAAVVSEKNEALRLLNVFVGRSGRSPPVSFSSVSESGTESLVRDSRRALSVDRFRRARAGVFNEEESKNL